MRFKAVATAIFTGLCFLSFMSSSSEPSVGLMVGDKAPEIEGNLLDGTRFSSSEWEGKMVLVDFWASYDAPSRVNNYRKKQLLEQYKNALFLNGEGLEVISVSLDWFKSPLYNSIERDQLEDFAHMCDWKGSDSPLAKAFQVEGPSEVFLLDGSGRIVERGNDLEEIAVTLNRLATVDQTRFAAYRR